MRLASRGLGNRSRVDRVVGLGQSGQSRGGSKSSRLEGNHDGGSSWLWVEEEKS